MSSEKDTHKILKSSTSSVLLNWIGKGSSLIFAIILARYLSVYDYGIAIGYLVFINLVDSFTLGLNSSVIQYSGNNYVNRLHVAWTYDNFISKIAFTLIILLFGDYLIYYITGLKNNVHYFIAVIPILRALESNAVTELSRNLEFHKKSFLELMRNLVFAIVSLLLVLIYGLGPISVVIGTIIAQGSRTILSYSLTSSKLKFDSSVLYLSSMWKFGKWITFSNLLKTFKNQLDKILLSSILGPSSLSIYVNGAKIPIQFSQDVSKNLTNILFPLYSQKGKYLGSFQSINIGIISVGLLVILLVIVFSENIILVLFGEKYLEAAFILKLMSPVIIIRPLYTNIESRLKSVGLSKIDFFSNLFYLAIIVSMLAIRELSLIHVAVFVLCAEIFSLFIVAISLKIYK